MATLTSYETGADAGAAIGDVGGNEYGHGQSFQLPSKSTITGAEIYVDDGPTPPTDAIIVRIETDNAGLPSGTLAHANATTTLVAASVPDNGAPAFASVTFTSFVLETATTYHLTVTVPDQSNGNYFQFHRDENNGAYANGEGTRETNASWVELNSGDDDFLFKIIGEVYVAPSGGNAMFFSSGSVTIG